MKKQIFIATTMATLLTLSSGVYAQDDSILEDSYITTQAFVKAEVMRIKKAERIVVVKGANQGKVREFYVPENTLITIRDKEAKFKDIRRGDEILISMVPKQTKVQIAQIRVPQTMVSLEDRQANPVDENLPAVLPQTATAWYSILGVGFMSMFLATFIRLRKSKK